MLPGERQRKREAAGKRLTFSIVSNNLALVWMGSLVLQNKNPTIKWTHPLEGSEQTWVWLLRFTVSIPMDFTEHYNSGNRIFSILLTF